MDGFTVARQEGGWDRMSGRGLPQLSSALRYPFLHGLRFPIERTACGPRTSRACRQPGILQNGINDYLGKIAALRALFQSSNNKVARGEFAAFSELILRHQTAIKYVSWIPRVGREGRTAIEDAAIRDGLSNYRIKAVTADGTLAPSAEKDEYYPIFYIFSVPVTSPIYGIDLNSEAMRRQAVERARDNDQPATSSVIMLQSGVRHQKFAVLCLGLDHFKGVNDALGHPVGDKLLRQVGERFRGCLSENDTLSRLGGDEFGILNGCVALQHETAALISRVVEVLKKPFDLDGQKIVMGVSIGIAVAPADGVEADELLKNADMALHRAKAEGGACRFFEPDMDAHMQARHALELDLRKALGNGEFELYYHPLVNLEAEKIWLLAVLSG